MLSITAICDLFAWTYIPFAIPPGTFDEMCVVNGQLIAGVKRIDGTAYVCFPGSRTDNDWLQDGRAIPYEDTVLGWVHAGFRDHAMGAKAWLDDYLKNDLSVVITGHSLGAAVGAIIGAWRIKEGKPMDWLVMFGEPRPGYQRLSDVYAGRKVDSFINKNSQGHDRVTDEPANWPAFPYTHIREPLTPCRRDPAPLDRWGPFAWHHFRLYAEAFGAAGPAVLALPDPGGTQ